jgi:hypothetical protein
MCLIIFPFPFPLVSIISFKSIILKEYDINFTYESVKDMENVTMVQIK